MSDLMNDPMVLRQILMDHYEYPRNHELTHDESYYTRHMASDSCIDDIHVEAKINNAANSEKIKEIIVEKSVDGK